MSHLSLSVPELLGVLTQDAFLGAAEKPSPHWAGVGREPR